MEEESDVKSYELWLEKNKAAKESVEQGLEQSQKGLIRKNWIDLDTDATI
jgi:hypothetical protein